VSPSDLALLEAASRTLLAPLAAPDPDAWRQEAARLVRLAVGADHAVFGISDQAQPYVLDGIDAATWERYAAYVTPNPDTWSTDDPVVDAWLRAHQASGGGAFDESTIEASLRPQGLTLHHSDLLNGVAWPNGMYGIRGITASAGTAGAGLQLMYERPGQSVGGDGLAVLHALLPAFRAGLDALSRLSGFRYALDAVAEPLVALDPDGRELHRNPALVRLLSADPERMAVEAALATLGRDLRRLAFPRRREAAGPLGPMQRRAGTAAGAYTLSASIAPAGALGPTETALVSASFAPARPVGVL
jgi:PAS domain-containing protein